MEEFEYESPLPELQPQHGHLDQLVAQNKSTAKESPEDQNSESIIQTLAIGMLIPSSGDTRALKDFKLQSSIVTSSTLSKPISPQCHVTSCVFKHFIMMENLRLSRTCGGSFKTFKGLFPDPLYESDFMNGEPLIMNFDPGGKRQDEQNTDDRRRQSESLFVDFNAVASHPYELLAAGDFKPPKSHYARISISGSNSFKKLGGAKVIVFLFDPGGSPILQKFGNAPFPNYDIFFGNEIASAVEVLNNAHLGGEALVPIGVIGEEFVYVLPIPKDCGDANLNTAATSMPREHWLTIVGQHFVVPVYAQVPSPGRPYSEDEQHRAVAEYLSFCPLLLCSA